MSKKHVRNRFIRPKNVRQRETAEIIQRKKKCNKTEWSNVCLMAFQQYLKQACL